MQDFQWIEMVTAFVSGGSFVALVKLVHFLLKRKDFRLKSKYSIHKVMKRIHDVYNEMNTILINTRAHRVIIAKIENGGSIPALGKNLYSSVVYEVLAPGFKSIHSDWDKQQIEESHIKVLLEVSTHGSLMLKKDDIPEDSILRNFYEANNINRSNLISIISLPGCYYYLALSYHEIVEETSEEKEFIRISANKIKRLFEDQYE